MLNYAAIRQRGIVDCAIYCTTKLFLDITKQPFHDFIRFSSIHKKNISQDEAVAQMSAKIVFSMITDNTVRIDTNIQQNCTMRL